MDYLAEVWPAGQPIYRAHRDGRDGNVFNPGVGDPTRFAFFRLPGKRSGPVVGVLYGGETSDVAISEYLFHDLPLGAGVVLPYSELDGACETRLIPKSDLKLAQLHGHGLRRLGLRNIDLIETPPKTYARTVRWAQAVHATDDDVQGLVWMSRQFNSHRAVVLFADRVDPADLVPDAGWSKRPYASGTGLAAVLRAARDALIAVSLPPR